MPSRPTSPPCDACKEEICNSAEQPASGLRRCAGAIKRLTISMTVFEDADNHPIAQAILGDFAWAS